MAFSKQKKREIVRRKHTNVNRQQCTPSVRLHIQRTNDSCPLQKKTTSQSVSAVVVCARSSCDETKRSSWFVSFLLCIFYLFRSHLSFFFSPAQSLFFFTFAPTYYLPSWYSFVICKNRDFLPFVVAFLVHFDAVLLVGMQRVCEREREREREFLFVHTKVY